MLITGPPLGARLDLAPDPAAAVVWSSTSPRVTSSGTISRSRPRIELSWRAHLEPINQRIATRGRRRCARGSPSAVARRRAVHRADASVGSNRGRGIGTARMTTVIEGFVQPQAWPTHRQWASMLPGLLCRRSRQACARLSAVAWVWHPACRGVRNPGFDSRENAWR